MNRTKSSWNMLVKIIFLIYALFVGFYQNRFASVSGLSTLFALAVIAVSVINIISNEGTLRIYIYAPLTLWFIFCVYSFVIGSFIATDMSLFSDRLIYYSASVLIIYCLSVISNQDGNLNYIMSVWITLGLLISVVMILDGVQIVTSTGTYYSLSASSNRNGLTLYMLLGIFAVFYIDKFDNLRNVLLSLFAILSMSYAIILGASRKGIIGIAIILIMWILFPLKIKVKEYSVNKKIIVAVVFILAICLIAIYFMPYFRGTYAFERMFLDAAQDSTNERSDLITLALQTFKDNPLFGVGFNQFRTVSGGSYAHNNYMEVLADTGIIGMLLYYIPYLLILVRLFKFIKNREYFETPLNKSGLASCFMMLALMIMILVLETALVTVQDFMTPIALGTLVTFTYSGEIEVNN